MTLATVRERTFSFVNALLLDGQTAVGQGGRLDIQAMRGDWTLEVTGLESGGTLQIRGTNDVEVYNDMANNGKDIGMPIGANGLYNKAVLGDLPGFVWLDKTGVGGAPTATTGEITARK